MKGQMVWNTAIYIQSFHIRTRRTVFSKYVGTYHQIDPWMFKFLKTHLPDPGDGHSTIPVPTSSYKAPVGEGTPGLHTGKWSVHIGQGATKLDALNNRVPCKVKESFSIAT